MHNKKRDNDFASSKTMDVLDRSFYLSRLNCLFFWNRPCVESV
jgi:hypothetical protein